jgi:ferric-dicitrate binding protein FerR (iron transport regulator)
MEYLQQLLQQYHEGTASPEEQAVLLSLLEANGMELQQALLDAFGDGIDTGLPLLAADRGAVILQKMQQQIRTTHMSTASPVIARKLWLKAMAWSAAAAVVILLIGTQWLQTGNNKTGEEPAAVAITVPSPVQLQKNSTQQKETILLPDSSTVVLFPGSIISYAKDFAPAHRSIHLQGEACFSVAKDAKRPFTVYANGVATTALGTRFNVSTFYSDERVRVRLIEGKVVVRSQEQALAMQPVYLTPGQECMVNKGNGEALVKAFTPAGATAKRNTTAGNTTIQKNNTAALEFSREPLVNVFSRIEKLYHVTIVYPGVTIGRLSFTGTFLPSDSLPVVLSIICKTNDLAFEQKDNLITITLLP